MGSNIRTAAFDFFGLSENQSVAFHLQIDSDYLMDLWAMFLNYFSF